MGRRNCGSHASALTSPLSALTPRSREVLPLPHGASGAEISVARRSCSAAASPRNVFARGRDHFNALAGGILRRNQLYWTPSLDPRDPSGLRHHDGPDGAGLRCATTRRVATINGFLDGSVTSAAAYLGAKQVVQRLRRRRVAAVTSVRRPRSAVTAERSGLHKRVTWSLLDAFGLTVGLAMILPSCPIVNEKPVFCVYKRFRIFSVTSPRSSGCKRAGLRFKRPLLLQPRITQAPAYDGIAPFTGYLWALTETDVALPLGALAPWARLKSAAIVRRPWDSSSILCSGIDLPIIN